MEVSRKVLRYTILLPSIQIDLRASNLLIDFEKSVEVSFNKIPRLS